uniref:SAC3/GANP/THP3 conserved domain-containing protein n=1 Tax=Chenopodium quinoa TaxID=63459 RepID=A0A803N789_CHEQI
MEEDTDYTTAHCIVGTCPFMCPEKERIQREQLRDLAVFERLNGNQSKSSSILAVKKIRFHVTSHHKLRRCEGDSTTLSSIHHLNMQQLTKCLGSLYNLYDINRTSDSLRLNIDLYLSSFILRLIAIQRLLSSLMLLLGESLSLWFSRLSSYIVSSKEMCFARTVLRSFRMGNFWRFFHTVASEATNLQFCIIEPYIMEVRAPAVACINSSGYKLHPYPLTSLSKILMIKGCKRFD